MNLTGKQKALILGIVVIVVLYLVYIQKEGAETVSDASKGVTNTDTKSVDTSMSSVILKEEPTLQQHDTDNLLLQKMTSKNSAQNNEYKQANYSSGNRFTASSNLDDFFEQGNPLNETDNNNFLPNDMGAAQASYSGTQRSDKGETHEMYPGGPRKELSDDEKFNASALLPKEEKQDWFEDVTPQKIKNRHLINIYRPIGVNTVITSRKNGSLDIRGNPVNPKTFVSPFLNSSIEPDVNARGICT